MVRIQQILDPGSFIEIGSMVSARGKEAEPENTGDGVVTGYGTIDGAPVYVYAQDAAFLGGSLGEMHAKKISKIYDMAITMKAPVIALLDCAGVRLNEANDALFSFGRLFAHQAKASGIVPQITAIFGTCGGGMAVSAAMADFVFMEKDSGKLFLHSPNAVVGNYEEKCDTASAAYQASKTGICDFAGTAEEVCAGVRELISLLPHSNVDDFSGIACDDDLNRAVAGIENLEDKSEMIAQLADNGKFVELKKDFGKGVITGFMKLNGSTIGVIANASKLLCRSCCVKIERFVRFCDAFNLPVLTLVDVQGFKRNENNEKMLPRELGRLTAAYAGISAPTVTVITGDAYGTAGTVMNSKAIGADLVYAWPNANLGIMEKSLLEGITDAVDADVNSAVYNARRGYIDGIIDPAETRQRLAAAFEMLYTKDAELLPRKHTTV